jgi:hypothetical protein
MAEILEPLASHKAPTSSSDHTRSLLLRSLEEVIHQAHKLDITLRRSRAFFQVYMTPINQFPPSNATSGFPLDPETMDYAHDFPRPSHGGVPLVDLVVSPGILKSGNADGKNYTKSFSVVKLRALCGLPAFLDAMNNRTRRDEPQVYHSTSREFDRTPSCGLEEPETKVITLIKEADDGTSFEVRTMHSKNPRMDITKMVQETVARAQQASMDGSRASPEMSAVFFS